MTETPTTAQTEQATSSAGRHSCPGCGGADTFPVWQAEGMPVHSCLLMDSDKRARGFPTGSMNLRACRRCGFMTNVAYDETHRGYGSDYEETQGFSARFNVFLVALARRLIERYELRGRRLLEIGCGKGEFLALMCDLGGNSGLGIDPAAVPERLPKELTGRLEVLREYYGPQHTELPADALICRHTLEHVAAAGEFMALIRSAARADTPVFLEVPDTLRILREGAFWDVYYEHCSYFTCGSLARLVRAHGFGIDDLYLDYGGQYVMLSCRADDSAGQDCLPLEDDLDETLSLAETFAARVGETLAGWREQIDRRRARGQQGVVWGSGSKGVAFLTALGLGDEITRVVDINPYRQGRFMPCTAQPIVAPRDLLDQPPDYVIIMNPIYRGEIAQQLRQLGLKPELLTV